MSPNSLFMLLALGLVVCVAGVIRYKRVGVVTPELLQTTILPLVQKLNAS